MTSRTSQKKATSTDVCVLEPGKNSMTAPPCSSITKVLALPPPPSSQAIKKPSTLKDAGVEEILGKTINSNDTVTNYTATVSSNLITLESGEAVLEKSKCMNQMEYEGKYISKKLKELIRIREFNLIHLLLCFPQ